MVPVSVARTAVVRGRRRPTVVAPGPVPGPGGHPAQGRLSHLHGHQAAGREDEASGRHHEAARHHRHGRQCGGQAGGAQAGQWRQGLGPWGRGGQRLRTSQTVQAPGRVETVGGGCNVKVVLVILLGKIVKKIYRDPTQQYDTVMSAS